ncbi:MAG: hypothetical protein ITD33_06160 [Nitrosarchaeum sp.]|jgi:hypothetical protein|nr:hypothetical protein [Nitrosarchaeum sp.]MBP0120420.1 hypothetical protein [Nitrosarchaeum sp.]MBP0134537.1 hypothetical protein [Nitrosarchaeum sp.]
MINESNEIKDFLFDYLNKSEDQTLISELKFSDIIDNVLENCFDKVVSIGKKEESLAILATGLLHYLLTNALISSQRKVEFNGINVDIVIPDLKTLEGDAKKTLILFIVDTDNEIIIKQRIAELYKIQPNKENIWIISGKNYSISNKIYVIEKKNSSFSNIIFDIAKFVNVQGQSKLKILRI